MGLNPDILRLKEEHRLRVFENLALRNIFGPKRGKIIGAEETYIARSFISYAFHQILLQC
jgi:hypothetical protein